jgi:hypothetical protein
VAVVRSFALLVLLAGAALADDRRAEVNYMLHCQGCHLPEARGIAGKVPPMNNFVGYFLHSDEGRRFLIRVPGVASSALGDEALAELMNWLLVTYSTRQLPAPFLPFTPQEVARLRTDPLADPDSARDLILADLADEIPAIAPEAQQDD